MEQSLTCASCSWPTTLDKESDKAARILRSFCKDGFYQEEDRSSTDGPNAKSKQRVVKKIPPEVCGRIRHFLACILCAVFCVFYCSSSHLAYLPSSFALLRHGVFRCSLTFLAKVSKSSAKIIRSSKMRKDLLYSQP